MANKTDLVIVESPSKAKTIGKYLGPGYEVKASMGHVRDLPKSKLSVDIEGGFVPDYQPIKGKEDVISDLKKAAKHSGRVYLATDPDREGEAISWHLKELLNIPDDKTYRVTFNEITKKVVNQSIAAPRAIDQNLVDAQQARRILDRIVGYQLSPLLWKKIRRGLSAGRVQSVATRMVCEREHEIAAFKPQEYWSLDARLSTDGTEKNAFLAHYHGENGKKKDLNSIEEVEAVVEAEGESPRDVTLEGNDEPYEGEFVEKGAGSNGTGSTEDPGTRDYAYLPLTNMDRAIAVRHVNGAHEGIAQIIILRYYREETPPEHGKYNVIHVYYQRTNHGDVWEGNSKVEEVDVGPLTNDNLYKTYNADGVERILHFQPKGEDREYPYVYDGAAYGKLIDSDNYDEYEGEGFAGEGKEYLRDDVMTSVKATAEGDQIIILRYYRSGGYNVVHEYYYREKADSAEDSSETEETPGDGSGGETVPEGREGLPQAEGDAFNGTLSDSDGFTYDFEGKSGTSSYSAALESWHDAGEVTKEPKFRPESQQYTYTYKDAVYGYLDKDSNVYSVAPYKTGVTANAQDDEIIILRYFRGDSSPVTPPDPTDPDVPDKPPTDPDDPPTKPENPPKDPEEPPEDPKDPPKDPENPPTDPENPPTDPENPPTDPENPPTNPEYPTELPDPNDPDSPDEITIWEDGVPKTYMKVWDPESESWIYIPEEQVPLWNKVPQTGDEGRTVLWAALAAASLCGSAALVLWSKKRKKPVSVTR